MKGQRGSGGLWLIDPIDGVKSFLYSNVMWSTILAYINNDNINLSALDLRFNERMVGTFGNTYIKHVIVTIYHEVL
ncbi:MAG: hypothetical protein ACTS4X_00870 [Candidatus Hodgkinia cicadicola]